MELGIYPCKLNLLGICKFQLGIGKIYMGNRTILVYIFYVTQTYLIGYSIIPLLIDTPSLKNNWVFQKKG